MSHLRAPAARADRREGGRHGRPAVRTAPALPETHIRLQLLRLAVLPPVAVALSGCAAVLFTVRSTGTRTGPTLWAVLGGAVFVALVGIAVAAVAANRAARSVHDRIGVLRRSTARREADLRTLVETLRRGDGPPQLAPQSRHGEATEDADDFDLLTADLSRLHDGAVTAVVQASQLSSQAGSEQKLEVFVNLARRLQSLVHREISILDELEKEMEDPDLLKGLFHVDHLATRIRRHAENLAVLGGAVSRRQWSNPVSMTEVLRSAIAEVEQYSRVKLVPPIDGQLRGHAVADVIHLLAELVENATVFSAPHTQVLLRANLVTSGLAVEVEDRGLGMPLEEQTRMNALLADPDQVNVARLLADGRIGLFVVSQLARRHGITVRLQTNIYGGVQAVLVVPQALLGAEPGAGAPGGTGQPEGAATAGTARPAVPGRQDGQAGRTGPGGQSGRHRHGQNGQAGAGAGVGGVSGGSSPAGDGACGVSSVPLPASGSGPSAPLAAPAVPQRPESVPQRPESVPQRHESLPQRHEALPQRHESAHQGHGSAPQRHEAAHQGPESVPQRHEVLRQGHDVLHQGHGTLPQGYEQEARQGLDETPQGGRPAPLPVRGARRKRPTPAEAPPGVTPDDRRVLAVNGTAPPTPRKGAVRGTMGKPHLPRRRAQEHIAPQLRDGPTPRRDPEHLVGHDPGLMAAFQRGISLAEAQQHMEAGTTEWSDVEGTHMESPHMESPHMDSAHTDPAPNESATPKDPMPVRPVHLEALPSELSPSSRPAPGVRSDHRTTTTRQDGSAPAG
ncbi:ATP-binding protein [Streptomyces sp. NPDC092370]|uniref:sensor histidine kinase n=1 Tax=Streptomyces sp. NPDC092370 TaxID=3366016 RepID=UPI003814FE35